MQCHFKNLSTLNNLRPHRISGILVCLGSRINCFSMQRIVTGPKYAQKTASGPMQIEKPTTNQRNEALHRRCPI